MSEIKFIKDNHDMLIAKIEETKDKLNNIGKTRVSIDFRLVDITKFIPNDKGSINTNTKFSIGDYFKKM